MSHRSEALVRYLTHAALLGGSLLPALVYLFVGLSAKQQMATDEAHWQSVRVGYAITANPDVWRFTVERLLDQIEASQHGDSQTLLTHNDGQLLGKTGKDVGRFKISAQAPLLDFGNVVGQLRVDIDIAPTLLHTALIGVLGLVLGVFCIRLLDRHVLHPLERTRVANHTLAFYDPLTLLSNRRLLMDRLEHALIGSKRTGKFGALIILDLDNFKSLNDTRGHIVGDHLLIQVARRLESSIREGDTVSRLGGDEYVVMLEGLGANEEIAAGQAEIIAEKIRQTLDQPYQLAQNRGDHHCTASIGVTLFYGQALPIEELLKQADIALYQAKAAGRNAIRFFNPAMQAAIDLRSSLSIALRNALQQNELQLYYQPQFDRKHQISGAEALLRWFPANQAPISPAHFIPLAEETGIIHAIGQWVLRTACAQLKAWENTSHTAGLQIAINVSARQFHQADFFEQVRDALQHSGANPTRLKLELTESVVLEDIASVIERMHRIRALGISFSLDDFGTGFSSLSYLKQLPLDQLKIDQSFVRDITHDTHDAAIVRAIITLSTSLGIEVIAEGIETEEQLEMLRASGCQNYQGYLFGKPQPIGELTAMLAAP